MKKSAIMQKILDLRKYIELNPECATGARVIGRIIEILAEEFKMVKCEECGNYFGETTMYRIWKHNPGRYMRRKEVCFRCCHKINEANKKLEEGKNVQV